MRRALPAIGLFFVAPLVAEFLLGNLSITLLAALFALAPMYGGGAVLIREIVRRTGRGWFSIITLAFGYAILEEAFLTQTLFNPNYLGFHLLEPAHIAALGMGAWWTVFVLTLHTVWSIPVSIGLVEGLVPERATAPWLGWIGLTVVAALFAWGSIAVARYSVQQDHNHFVASVPQFVTAGMILLIVIIVGLRLPRTSSDRTPAPVPSSWIIGAIALVAGSLFLVVPVGWGWGAVASYLTMDVIVIVLVSRWSRRTGWNSRHRLALAGGAGLAYAWHAFIEHPVAGNAGMVNRVGNAVFALALIGLLAMAARRIGRQASRAAAA